MRTESKDLTPYDKSILSSGNDVRQNNFHLFAKTFAIMLEIIVIIIR
jgi:hypothetical protein